MRNKRKYYVRFPRAATLRNHAQKKTLRYSEQLDPDVQDERKAWRRKTRGVDPSSFVFLDESNAKTTMARLYGRAARGERVIDYVPDGRYKSVTMLSALRYDGTTTALVYQGGTDASAMLTFMEHELVPTLTPDDIVVMDNLSSHHDPQVISAIEATGARVWFLPRYSPDYNPIEEMWSKVKSLLKKIAARTEEALIDAIGRALQSVTAEDAMGWFSHCGYPSMQT